VVVVLPLGAVLPAAELRPQRQQLTFVYLNALPIHEVYRRIMVRSLPALLASS